MKKISSFFMDLFFCIKMSFCASKLYFTMKCIIAISNSFFPILSFLVWKHILNAIAEDHWEITIIYCMICYFSIKMLIYVSDRVNDYVNNRYSDEIQFYIESVMIEKTSRVDLSFFDSATMGDKISRVRSNFYVATETTWLVFDLISETVGILIAASIIFSFNWGMGILTFILQIPYLLYNKEYNNKVNNMEKKHIRDRRKAIYFLDFLCKGNGFFETKLNDTGKYFINEYDRIWTRLFSEETKLNIRNCYWELLFSIVSVISIVLGGVVLGEDIYLGKIGIGDFQYIINMIMRLREQATVLIKDANHFGISKIRLAEFKEFMKIETERENSGSLLPPATISIEFKHVFFKYPNSSEYVLKDCSFAIGDHEKIGIVGLNGSGKSTVLKLILGFYRPQEGNILINGIDIKKYDIYKLREKFGVLYQDYVTYCIPFREIVSFPDFDDRYNDNRINSACVASGIYEIVKDWNEGIDSVLGRFYGDNGKDLSGGQWQMTGLARVYFANRKIVVLDEPSAALDPMSENKLFHEIYMSCKYSSAITISHRLSNTILSDRIIVLSEGNVIEEGTHSQLMLKAGRYAQMFHLQASKYL